MSYEPQQSFVTEPQPATNNCRICNMALHKNELKYNSLTCNRCYNDIPLRDAGHHGEVHGVPGPGFAGAAGRHATRGPLPNGRAMANGL